MLSWKQKVVIGLEKKSSNYLKKKKNAKNSFKICGANN